MDYLKMLSVVLDPLSRPSWCCFTQYITTLQHTYSYLYMFINNS